MFWTTLLRWLFFRLGSLTVDFHSPALLDSFLSCDAIICSTVGSPPLANSNHVASFPIDFKLKTNAPFYCTFVLIGTVFLISWVISIGGHLIHYHVFQQLVLLPWLVQISSFVCKVKFRQASNHYKRVLQAAKLAYDNKAKESIISEKRGSGNFWQIGGNVLIKFRSALLPLFNGPEVISSFDESWLRRSKPTLISQRHLVLIVFLWWFWRTKRLVAHLERCDLSSDVFFIFSQSTADLLIIVSDIIARAFNRLGLLKL